MGGVADRLPTPGLLRDGGSIGSAGGLLIRRLAAVLGTAVLLVLTGPVTAAHARSFELPEARVQVRVLPDGTLRVTEHITFAFDGSFQGAYRDIPVGPGEGVTQVGVSEGGRDYRAGAPTALGSTGEPGSYGVADLGDRMRVVWHYRATDEVRVFTITYRMTGVAVAYDDVVDVQFQVWGDEWERPLGLLDAPVELPEGARPGAVRVWGHPAGVAGTVGFGPDGTSPRLTAFGIPAGQFVEIRFVFPRELLTSTGGARVVEGEGLERIVAEEAELARQAAEERLAVQRIRERWPWFAAGSLVPALLVMGALYLGYGREPRVPYDREYEQEPPSDDAPALVGALLDQRLRIGAAAFTATLFDLIRRGVLRARHRSMERSTWGGLRTETISDLEISMSEDASLDVAHEIPVLQVVRRVLADGPQPLSEFRRRIRDDAEANSKSYQDFGRKVRRAITKRRKLFDRAPTVWMVSILLLFYLAAGAMVFFGVRSLGATQLARGVLLVVLAGASFVNALILTVFAVLRSGWVRRTGDGALLAVRWEAFRRYLRDFSRLEEAPPASLALWEQYLVYGIALGVAEEVLEGARLHAPPVVQESELYWFGSDGAGGGLTGNAISGIEHGLASAFSPPSSGGGGGFSGGGGGGSGGGGGGAW